MGIIRVWDVGDIRNDLVVIFSHGDRNLLLVQCGFSWLVPHLAQISAFFLVQHVAVGQNHCEVVIYTISRLLYQRCLLSVATGCVLTSVEFNQSEEPVVVCADFYQTFIDCKIPPRLWPLLPIKLLIWSVNLQRCFQIDLIFHLWHQ